MVVCWVSRGVLYFDPLMHKVYPIIYSFSSDIGKGKEHLSHWVIHNVISFIESEANVEFTDEGLCLGSISIKYFRGVSYKSSIGMWGCRGRSSWCCNLGDCWVLLLLMSHRKNSMYRNRYGSAGRGLFDGNV